MKLDKMKKELELRKVELARQELELKIAERLEDIERMKAHIQVQAEKEQEIKQELDALKGE